MLLVAAVEDLLAINSFDSYDSYDVLAPAQAGSTFPRQYRR
jgi:hypothetical protein